MLDPGLVHVLGAASPDTGRSVAKLRTLDSPPSLR